ncbi:MAG: LEA type 2 family protein [Acidobacteriota bacterium]|nr:LEA type 2 family protein [Acidobacteriota bacterium]
MRRHLLKPILGACTLLLTGLALHSCASSGHLFEAPRVELAGIELTGLSLSAAELRLDFQVRNPNRLRLVLLGVVYKVRVEGQPLLDSSWDERTEVAARGLGRFQLPVKIGLLDLYRVARSIRGKERPLYDVDALFRFDVPVLGAITVPVHRRGAVRDLGLPGLGDREGQGR